MNFFSFYLKGGLAALAYATLIYSFILFIYLSAQINVWSQPKSLAKAHRLSRKVKSLNISGK